MILPLPRVLSGSVLRFVLKLRADGPLQSPPNPETLQAYATQSNFGFPRTPKTKGPKGVPSRIHLWGFWGFGATGKRPGRASLALILSKDPLARRAVSSVGDHTETLSANSIPSFRQ